MGAPTGALKLSLNQNPGARPGLLFECHLNKVQGGLGAFEGAEGSVGAKRGRSLSVGYFPAIRMKAEW
jgi:hypothetical protein